MTEQVLSDAIQHYGAAHQMNKLHEELGECLSALYLHRVGEDSLDHFIEECVDVEVMINQMRLIFPSDSWAKIRQFKLDRLEKRIASERCP